MKKVITVFAALLAAASLSSASIVAATKPQAKYVAKENRRNAATDSYYKNVDTSSGQALSASLTKIIQNPNVVGYSNLWTVYNDSDVRIGKNGKKVYWDMYSNVEHEVGKYSGGNGSEGAGMNKEHSVPQSWFNEASPMKSDAFHVYPTDCYVNNMRSSYPYGETSNPKKTSGNGSKLGPSSFEGYSGTVFEPIDEYKGDFARTYFYMATCYSSRVGSWTKGEAQKVFQGSYPYLTKYAVELFTKWDAQDPVSQKEIDRNNAVQKHQGNRNPFIDHPEYASIIWPSKYNTNVTVDQAKVDAVIAKISALPAVASLTLDDKAAVDAANTAYAALNFKEKEKVTNYSTLQAALNKIAELQVGGGGGGDKPTPDPVPVPRPDGDELALEFKGINTAFTKNYSFEIGGYGFTTNVAFANPEYGNFVRIGGNAKNATDIPSKFGISGKGGSIEMTFDVENSTGIKFNVGGQMTGKDITKWTILGSTDGGSTWTKLASDSNVGTSLTATLDAPAASIRYALVSEGKNSPRLDLTGLVITLVDGEPKVNLEEVTTNSYLDVNYVLENNEIVSASAKTAVVSHVDLEYNLESVTYGVVYTAKSNVAKLIKLAYTRGTGSELAALVNGAYASATLTEGEDECVVKALLDLDLNTEYVAVIVCEQNGSLVFANQATLSVKNMVSHYLDNNLVTDAEQVLALQYLLG